MNNLVILPILIPLLAATLLIFMNKNTMLSRGFSVFASLLAIICNVYWSKRFSQTAYKPFIWAAGKHRLALPLWPISLLRFLC